MTFTLAKLLLTGGLLLATAAPTFAAPPLADNRGDRIDQRLDNRGAHINGRLDNRAARAAANGHAVRAAHLDAKGNRIENRLDRKGNRIDRRIDRRQTRRN